MTSNEWVLTARANGYADRETVGNLQPMVLEQFLCHTDRQDG